MNVYDKPYVQSRALLELCHDKKKPVFIPT